MSCRSVGVKYQSTKKYARKVIYLKYVSPALRGRTKRSCWIPPLCNNAHHTVVKGYPSISILSKRSFRRSVSSCKKKNPPALRDNNNFFLRPRSRCCRGYNLDRAAERRGRHFVEKSSNHFTNQCLPTICLGKESTPTIPGKGKKKKQNGAQSDGRLNAYCFSCSRPWRNGQGRKGMDWNGRKQWKGCFCPDRSQHLAILLCVCVCVAVPCVALPWSAREVGSVRSQNTFCRWNNSAPANETLSPSCTVCSFYVARTPRWRHNANPFGHTRRGLRSPS